MLPSLDQDFDTDVTADMVALSQTQSRESSAPPSATASVIIANGLAILIFTVSVLILLPLQSIAPSISDHLIAEATVSL